MVRKRGRGGQSVPHGRAATIRGAHYEVVDLETTGFSPGLGDRIIEIAMMRVNMDGTVEDEWTTLVNPLRDVGATAVHGITAEEVEDAPVFEDIIGDILARLERAVFVAHNARFDRDFLAAELAMAGVFAPASPLLCTLTLARRLYPRITNHQLSACCEAAGLFHEGRHEALTDARAVARLLLVLLAQSETSGQVTLEALGCIPSTFATEWPAFPVTGRFCRRTGQARPEIPYLARMVASLGPVRIDSERIAPYLDLLDRVLEDRSLTEDEATALGAIAAEWQLSRDEVTRAHESYLESLIAAAVADGRVTELERRDLEAVSRALCVDRGTMRAVLSEARRARDTGPVLQGPT